MIEIDEKLIELAESYYSHFGETIPLRMFPETITYEQLYETVKECIDKDSPELIEKFFDTVTEDILI